MPVPFPRFASSSSLVPTFIWLLGLVLIGAAYASGVHAPFLFDDYPNLDGLKNLQGKSADIYDLIQYSLTGTSSQMGRPIALLSFALQKDSWPNHPEDFLLVNILIHLLNSVLLALWLRKALRLAELPEKAVITISLLASGLWAAAPIHVGAVLYAVQRMALLSCTFGFLGILIYLTGRERLGVGRTTSALVLMTLGVGVGVGVGVLAKENAALLPLLILVMEATLLQKPANRAAWRLACGLLLVLPTLLLLGYLVYQFPNLLEEYVRRAFSMYERLLTESRLLVLYLRKILLPSTYGMRMFYDDFPLSKSLLDPISTLESLIFWACLLLISVRFRRPFRFLTFAVLWFLCAHILESTVIPLEIGFDHRNYVAAVGPLLFLAWAAVQMFDYAQNKVVRLIMAAALTLYSGYSLAACWQTSLLRGQSLQQASFWAYTQPESPRAHFQYAMQLITTGHVPQAADIYTQMHLKWPHDPTITVMSYEIGCVLPNFNSPSLDDVISTLHNPWPDMMGVAASVTRIVATMLAGSCPNHSKEEIERLTKAAVESPNAGPWYRLFYEAYAFAAHANGHHLLALQLLDKEFRIHPDLAIMRQRVYWAVEAGDLDAAHSSIRMAEQDPRVTSIERWTFRQDIAGMKQLVEITEEYKRNPETGSPHH